MLTQIGPFFPYYGSKWRIARRYPVPQHRLIIEPFAGGAAYSTAHWQRDVLLCDVSPFVEGVWRYLIRASRRDILSLPAQVEHADAVRGPIEARWLIGFWLNTAQVYPNHQPSSWAKSGRWPGKFWGEKVRERIASEVQFIRHWRVRHASWEDLPNSAATWFVDPPYSGAPGLKYRRFKLNAVEFSSLAGWCRERQGQVIVCENEGATWLPFQPFMSSAALAGRSAEAIWMKEAPC